MGLMGAREISAVEGAAATIITSDNLRLKLAVANTRAIYGGISLAHTEN